MLGSAKYSTERYISGRLFEGSLLKMGAGEKDTSSPNSTSVHRRGVMHDNA